VSGSRFIVITSIYPPTEAVRAFAALDGWQVVVVGDRKSPPDWALEGVTYLSPSDQEGLGFRTVERLPWNHYGRKMVGYLYAMQQGAELILDTDDDNVPKPDWRVLPTDGKFATVQGSGFVNVYRYFTDAFVWPRGYPLRSIRATAALPDTVEAARQVGIWQLLADGDTDVDAIYRLVIDAPVAFRDRPPLVLDEGVVCPFNSQNTVFTRDAFPLLYLPAFVTFRYTDILRGLVAQPLLWSRGLCLGFGPATVVQQRNPHDYLDDLESEVPMYLTGEEALEAATGAVVAGAPLAANLTHVYADLRRRGIVTADELGLLDAWLEDVAVLTT
jgi:hypothetical protein